MVNDHEAERGERRVRYRHREDVYRRVWDWLGIFQNCLTYSNGGSHIPLDGVKTPSQSGSGVLSLITNKSKKNPPAAEYGSKRLKLGGHPSSAEEDIDLGTGITDLGVPGSRTKDLLLFVDRKLKAVRKLITIQPDDLVDVS